MMKINSAKQWLRLTALILVGLQVFWPNSHLLANPATTDDTLAFSLDTRRLPETDMDDTLSFLLDTRGLPETSMDDTLSFSLDTRRLPETDMDDTLSFLLDTRRLAETDTDDTLSFLLDTRLPLVSLQTTAQHGTIARIPDQEQYEQGTTVTLTATPEIGYLFSGWSGTTTSTLNPLTLIMNTTRSITATFIREPRKSAAQWLLH